MALALDGLSPTIAVGFRKLLTAYAGQCFQAENSGGTQDIGFSGNDADEAALATFGAALSTWVNIFYDQSGNARNASEGTEAGVVRAASANTTLGGKLASTLGGVGSGQIGVRATAMSTLLSAANATVLSCFSVTANGSNSADSYGNSAIWKDTGSNVGLHMRNNGGTHTLKAYNWDGSDDHADQTYSLSGVLAVAWRHTGGNIEINVNNGGWVQAASGNTADLSANLQIGKDVGTSDYIAHRHVRRACHVRHSAHRRAGIGLAGRSGGLPRVKPRPISQSRASE
jgi:hypothetical protein